MRINPATSFADKDAVKALGARWDVARRVWYIENRENLKPFLRWIPQAQGFDERAAPRVAAPQRRLWESPDDKPSPKPNHPGKGVATTSPSRPVEHCGCDVLPWLDCVHTRPPE